MRGKGVEPDSDVESLRKRVEIQPRVQLPSILGVMLKNRIVGKHFRSLLFDNIVPIELKGVQPDFEVQPVFF